MKPWSTLWAGALLALGLCAASHAQLLVGQTVGVTGSAAATVKESMGGAALYINHVNAKGGVGGRRSRS